MQMPNVGRMVTINIMLVIIFEVSKKDLKKYKRNKATRNMISLLLIFLLKILISKRGILMNNKKEIETRPILL